MRETYFAKVIIANTMLAHVTNGSAVSDVVNTVPSDMSGEVQGPIVKETNL